MTIPKPEDMRLSEDSQNEIKNFLDERKLITTVLSVQEPNYLFVSVRIELMPKPGYDPVVLQNEAWKRLARYLNPISGGPEGSGFYAGYRLTLADIYAALRDLPSLAFVLNRPQAEIFTYTSTKDRVGGRWNPQAAISWEVGRVLAKNETFAAKEITIITQSYEPEPFHR